MDLPARPNFAAKAGVVLDLYGCQFEGRTLRSNEFVISADEKTSIQARVRCYPSLAVAAARPMRVEHEYERGGSLAYVAAWDVHHARLFGRLEPKTGIAAFDRLVDEVMAQEPYRRARRVFWIVDNGISHRGEKSVQRLRAAYPNLRLVHLPIHASWLNQVEIYFSILQRKVLTPNDVGSLEHLARNILDFQVEYQAAAKPFEWKFTRDNLIRLLARLKAKEAQRHANAA